MNNPKVTAAISGLVAIYIAYSMYTATEAPSATLALLNWALLGLALVGCVGSLVKIARGE